MVFTFPLRKRKQNKIPWFSLVVVLVRMGKYRTYCTQISRRNSFPNFVGVQSILKLPLSKLCAVPPALQNRAFSGKVPREKRPAKGAKGKRTRENRSEVLRLGTPIPFKIITRMKLLFSNYLGDYSYSFQGSSELIALQLQFPSLSSRMQLQE